MIRTTHWQGMSVRGAVLLCAAVVCLTSCREPSHPPESDPPDAGVEDPPLDAGPYPLPRGTIGSGRGCQACNVECTRVGQGSRFGGLVTADDGGLVWLWQSCRPDAIRGISCEPALLKANPYKSDAGEFPLAMFYQWSGWYLYPTELDLVASEDSVYWQPGVSVSRRGSEPLPEIDAGPSQPDTFAMNSTSFFSVRAREGLVRTSRETGGEHLLTTEAVRILALDDSTLVAEVTPSDGGVRYAARYNLASTAPPDFLVEAGPQSTVHAAVLRSRSVALMIGHPYGSAQMDGRIVWVRQDGRATSLLEEAPGVEMAAVAHQDGFVVAWANCFAFGNSCATPPQGESQWWRGGVYQWQPRGNSFRALCEGALQARSIVSDGMYVYVMTQDDILRLRP